MPISNESLAPASAPSGAEGGVTLRDVAARVGVSVQSVSGVLNGGGSSSRRVSASMRAQIESAAEELGYRRNHAARAMRTGDTRMLGWLGGNLGEEQVGKMLDGALEASDACGYTLKILRLGDLGNAQQVIRRASELRLMGMLALHLPSDTQAELNAEAQCYGYPLVLMDERSEKPGVLQVTSDDEDGIAQAISHLCELGHGRIAFLGAGKDAGVTAARREQAFVTEMARSGLTTTPNSVVQGSFVQRERSLLAARQLLCLPIAERPTAIVCAGDYIALAVLQVARDLQIDVPAELSVVGFANVMCSDYATPQLTTVEQPFTDIGRRAVHLLLNVIDGQSRQKIGCGKATGIGKTSSDGVKPVNSSQMLRLPTHLIARASTAPSYNALSVPDRA